MYVEYTLTWIGGMLGGMALLLSIQHLFGLRKTKPTHVISLSSDDWTTLATGRSGWLEIEQAWLRKAQEVYTIFCEKQADYGPTNIAVGGTHGITVRLGDKISRLFELLGLTERRNSGEPTNESIRDTMVDLGDYGIIGMIVLDGEWPGVEPETVWGNEAFLNFVMQHFKENPDHAEVFMERFGLWRIAEQMAADLGGEVVSA